MTVEIVVTAPVTEVNPITKVVDVIVNAPVVEVNPVSNVVEITVKPNVVEIIPENRTVTLITAGIQGPQGIRGPTGPSGSGSFTMIAGEIIGANAPIKVNADGFAYIASNLVGTDSGNIVGISENSALIGEEVQVSRGELHNSNWAFVLGAIYVGNRIITQVPPAIGFTQIIATAISPVDIIGTLFTPIELTG